MTWEQVKIGDVVRFNYGKALVKQDRVETGEFDVFSSAGVIGKHDEPSHSAETIIIGRKGSAGSVIYAPDGGRVIDTAYYLTSIANKKFDWKYLYYALKSLNLESLATATAMPGLNREDVYKKTIPLPPLPIQQRIAAVLDEVDALRQKRERSIEMLQGLARSLFLDIYGDIAENTKGHPMVSLKKCFSSEREPTKCGPFGSALKKEDYADEGIPVWTMKNIQGSSFNPDDCLFIPESKFLGLASYKVAKGDIIISRAGTVGKMCVVDFDGPSIISTNLISLSLDSSKLLPEFFIRLMEYGKGKVGRLKTGDDGAYSYMNTGILQSLVLPIPELSIQLSYLEKLNLIKSDVLRQEQHLKNLAVLTDSLQARAFAGELELRELAPV